MTHDLAHGVPDAATAAKLQERYGTKNNNRNLRIIVAIAVLLGLALTVWIGFGTVQRAAQTVTSQTNGYSINPDTGAVTIKYQASAPQGADYACALEAQDEEHGVVGWLVVVHEGSDALENAHENTFPVIAPATTGFVNSCWLI